LVAKLAADRGLREEAIRDPKRFVESQIELTQAQISALNMLRKEDLQVLSEHLSRVNFEKGDKFRFSLGKDIPGDIKLMGQICAIRCKLVDQPDGSFEDSCWFVGISW
jgi:hypothetical protein